MMKIYIICCVPAQISYLGKLIPEICAKMFLATQIAGFFDQLYLQNKSLKWPHFLLVDTNLHVLKLDQNIFGCALSKLGLASLTMEL